MATAPVKSPLHNFPLTFLRWGNSSRCRRPASADGVNEASDAEPPTRRSRAARNRLASCSSSAKDAGSGGDGDVDAEHEPEPEPEPEPAAVEQKPWKLRPRKALFPKAKNNGGGGGGGGESNEVEGGGRTAAVGGAGDEKSARLRGLAESSSSQLQQLQSSEKGTTVEAEKKRKFWIALSREEIEEDVFIMTGSRPARRPKKRSKIVQKQLDAVFPGLWLVGITAEAYRAAETQPKR